MSDDRLRENLRKAGVAKAGVPDVAIGNLDHTSLHATWAELVATGRDKPIGAAVTYTEGKVEQQRLQFEERKWAEQLQLETEKTCRDHIRICLTFVSDKSKTYPLNGVWL